MSASQLLPATGRAGQPWKNGGGQTFQLATYPEGSSLEDFGWRVSIAEIVSDGPFSTFPGVDRIIAVIDGAGMDLDLDDKVHQLGKFTTYRFPGEAAITAHLLRGPTRDLNVMVRRGQFVGRMEIFSSSADRDLPVRIAEGETLLVVGLDGQCHIGGEDTSPIGAEDVILRREAGISTVRLHGTVAIVHIREL